MPIENWRDWDIFGIEELQTVKNMFGFCQHANGWYYGAPNDVTPAKQLKQAAAKAKGLDGDVELMTVERFVTKYFSS